MHDDTLVRRALELLCAPVPAADRPAEPTPELRNVHRPLEPGSIVLVESKDQHVLAAVDLVSIEEPGTNLRPGLWLCLIPADGEWFWCHESRVLDRDPACPSCGQHGRWQRVGTAFVCVSCKRRAEP
jgi:hypothetical protein